MKSLSLIRLSLVALLFFHASAVAQDKTPEAIDNLLRKAYPAEGPGAVVLIAKDGRIIAHKAYGKASLKTGEGLTTKHVFRIGSITKQFTSTAILKLVSDGKLTLDQPVAKFIPEYANGHNITIRHLLTHTSGIKNYTSLMDQQAPEIKSANKTIQQRFNVFKDLPLEFQPGEKHEYSNSNYFLLGMIIEKITGMSYGDYLGKTFFNPLKLTSSYYDGGDKGIPAKAVGHVSREQKFVEGDDVHHSMPYAAGALASTAEDLYKWTQAVSGFKVVPKTLMEEAWAPARLNDGTAINYGYGWSIGRLDDLMVIYHGGAIDGYVGYLVTIPSKKYFSVILTNKVDYGLIDQSEKIARIVLAKPVQNPPTFSVTADDLQEYTGIYKSADSQFRHILLMNEKLSSANAFGDTVELRPYKKDGFFMQDMAVSLEFERDSDSRISAVKVTASDWIPSREVKLDSAISARKSIKLDPSLYDQYVGIYEVAKGFTIKFWRNNDQYMATSSLHGDFEIKAESDGQFYIPGMPVSFEFIKANDSPSTYSVVVHANGEVNKGIKISQ
jgi:CubicO group peptidase (beta-lactamase class C family)